MTCVYLVGAGPGNPGLITVRGRDLLARADVIVYDNLAAPELLRHAPEDAEKIYVGKKAGNHALPQDQINQLLIDKAAEVPIVVRLKGGDPYVFGRGGEEALALAQAGVRFEVVPGVTAGVAAPAYAGIPITHRDFASDVAFITGHEDAARVGESQVDWQALGQWRGTLAFYMGVRNLPLIAERLMAHGMDPQKPAAIIHAGATPRQQTITAPLSELPEAARQANIKPPALILVGDVVQLRDKLQWFEQRPLFGRCIIVTRARAQASDLIDRLTELGAEVLEYPTIRIAPPEDLAPLRIAIGEIGNYHWAIFTSVNGVDAFFTALAEQGADTRRLAGLKVAAIGPATTDRLTRHGIKADLIPPQYVAESIVESLTAVEDLSGKSILLPRADIARSTLPDALAALGARVTDLPAYRTVTDDAPTEHVIEALQDRRVDYITFTSSSTVRNFFARIDIQLLKGEKPHLASIGPITTATIKEYGLTATVQAEEYTIDKLVQAICSAEGQP